MPKKKAVASKKTARKQKVIVTIEDSHAEKISEVKEKLMKAGLQQATANEALGMVFGSIDGASRMAIKKVAGVRAVEDEGEMTASGE